MVFSRGAVHSALWLVLTMLCLGCLYIAQNAEFLGFVQIIVYTGAIMMLFLFVLMLTGRDAGDSVFEVLRGQRIVATVLGIAFVVAARHRAAAGARARCSTVGLDRRAGRAWARSAPSPSVLFTDYLFPFELTSALLITAATGAMVLTHLERAPGTRKTQRQRVHERMRSDRMSPLPGPGVFATIVVQRHAGAAAGRLHRARVGVRAGRVRRERAGRAAVPQRRHAHRDRERRAPAAHRADREPAAPDGGLDGGTDGVGHDGGGR